MLCTEASMSATRLGITVALLQLMACSAGTKCYDAIRSAEEQSDFYVEVLPATELHSTTYLLCTCTDAEAVVCFLRDDEQCGGYNGGEFSLEASCAPLTVDDGQGGTYTMSDADWEALRTTCVDVAARGELSEHLDGVPVCET